MTEDAEMDAGTEPVVEAEVKVENRDAEVEIEVLDGARSWPWRCAKREGAGDVASRYGRGLAVRVNCVGVPLALGWVVCLASPPSLSVWGLTQLNGAVAVAFGWTYSPPLSRERLNLVPSLSLGPGSAAASALRK